MLDKAAEQAALAREWEAAGESARARFAAGKAAGFLRTANRLAAAMTAYKCDTSSVSALVGRPLLSPGHSAHGMLVLVSGVYHRQARHARAERDDGMAVNEVAAKLVHSNIGTAKRNCQAEDSFCVAIATCELQAGLPARVRPATAGGRPASERTNERYMRMDI